MGVNPDDAERQLKQVMREEGRTRRSEEERRESDAVEPMLSGGRSFGMTTLRLLLTLAQAVLALAAVQTYPL